MLLLTRRFLIESVMWRPFHFLPHLIPLQYTGLKDKNGKEIYEGDVIRTDNYKGIHVFVVEYEFDYCGALGAFVFNTKDEASSVHCEANETGDVIGNIYENPELLEKK